MSHSYSTNLLHCVFSTKEKRPTIRHDLREKLWAYLMGACDPLGIKPLATGGTNNHVHLLIALPATLRLSEALQKLKANSSRWIGEHGHTFSWQEGYAAFSVSPGNVRAVTNYIARQEEHHRKRSFEEEFVAMLQKAGVAYDPKYVFG